jgi:hypothetical protein
LSEETASPPTASPSPTQQQQRALSQQRVASG